MSWKCEYSCMVGDKKDPREESIMNLKVREEENETIVDCRQCIKSLIWDLALTKPAVIAS